MARSLPRPQNLNIDTRNLEPVTFQAPRVSPPIELQPLRSPFLISSLPTTATVNPDSIKNFAIPGLPQYRITPPPPITQSSGAANATAGVKTVPRLLQPTPAPTIAQALISIPTGYQFSFLQVRLPLQDTVAISSYKIYRSTANNSASATVIQSVIHHQANVGVPVIIQDNQPNGVFQLYWVSAINNRGLESNLVPAQNGFVLSNAGFTARSQLASSLNNNPLNVSFANISSTVLSNDGSAPPISVSSSTLQFGFGLVSYNSATINPGGFNTFFTYAFDPFFSGGAAVYLSANQPIFQASGDAILPFGKITTVNGSSSVGGGNSAGGSRGINL
jgi:hypothetical protein